MKTTAQESNKQATSQFRVMPTASGHAMLLSAEDFPIYHLHMTRLLTRFQPQDQREADLVQRITDNEWRIERIARLEMGLYARGQLEFAALYSDQTPEVRSLLIETHTHSTYARQLNGLSVQEARLRRYVEKDLAELQKLQDERAERESQKKALTAAASSTHPHQTSDSISVSDNGFEFADSLSTESHQPKPDRSYRNGKVSQTNGKVTRH